MALNARPAQRRPAGGWSLAETVFAAGLLSIMLATTTSVLVLATRTLRPGASGEAAVRRAEFDRVVDLLRSDLSLANTLLDLEPDSIRVLVPAREGTGDQEIEYRFSALNGGTLQRVVNGEAATLIGEIKGLTFTALADERESGPRLEADGADLVLAASGEGTTSELNITLLSGAAITVVPVLPVNAESWEVRGVRVRARRGASPNSRVEVELRTPVGLLPGGTVLASASITGNNASNVMDWLTIDLPATVIPSGLDALSVTVRASNVLAPIVLETAIKPSDRDWDISYTGTLGAWIPIAGRGVTYELLGRVVLPRTSMEKRLTALRLEIMPTDGAEGATDVVIPLLQPALSQVVLP